MDLVDRSRTAKLFINYHIPTQIVIIADKSPSDLLVCMIKLVIYRFFL